MLTPEDQSLSDGGLKSVQMTLESTPDGLQFELHIIFPPSPPISTFELMVF